MAKIGHYDTKRKEKVKNPTFCSFLWSPAVLHPFSSPSHSQSQSFCITSFNNRNGYVKTLICASKTSKQMTACQNYRQRYASAVLRSVLETLHFKFRIFSKIWGNTDVKPRFMSSIDRTVWPTIDIFAKINTLLRKNLAHYYRFTESNWGGLRTAIPYITLVSRDHFLVCILAKFLNKILFFKF